MGISESCFYYIYIISIIYLIINLDIYILFIEFWASIQIFTILLLFIIWYKIKKCYICVCYINIRVCIYYIGFKKYKCNTNVIYIGRVKMWFRAGLIMSISYRILISKVFIYKKNSAIWFKLSSLYPITITHHHRPLPHHNHHHIFVDILSPQHNL